MKKLQIFVLYSTTLKMQKPRIDVLESVKTVGGSGMLQIPRQNYSDHQTLWMD